MSYGIDRREDLQDFFTTTKSWCSNTSDSEREITALNVVSQILKVYFGGNFQILK